MASRYPLRQSTVVATILAVTAFALMSGCGKPGGNGDSASIAPSSTGAAVGASESAASNPSNAAPVLPRKIIYTGTVEMAAEDIMVASRKITTLVNTFHGYIAESSSGGGGEGTGKQLPSLSVPREATWKIRIPADQFNEFLNALGGVGELQNRHVTSQDVSEEFYDVAARLKNKRIEESRLLEHMKASGKLSDILLLEKELSRVREEIERTEGRLRFLANQTDLSTIDITLRQTEGFRPEVAPSLWTESRRTFGASLSALADFGRTLLIAIIALLPWAMVLGAIATPLVLARRRRRRTQAATASLPNTAVSAIKQRLSEQDTP